MAPQEEVQQYSPELLCNVALALPTEFTTAQREPLVSGGENGVCEGIEGMGGLF